ncbi:hypothetical protein BH10ACI4_BH10ACI4_32690 [soil metagenome]
MVYTTRIDSEPRLVALLDAAQNGPVFIERDQQQGAVLVSKREYDRLRGTVDQSFQEFCDSISDKAIANGMTEAILNDLLNNA